MNYLLSPIFECYFLILIRSSFFTFFVFLYLIMYILNITSAIKKMSVNEIRGFIAGNYYEQIGFLKKTFIIQ